MKLFVPKRLAKSSNQACFTAVAVRPFVGRRLFAGRILGSYLTRVALLVPLLLTSVSCNQEPVVDEKFEAEKSTINSKVESGVTMAAVPLSPGSPGELVTAPLASQTADSNSQVSGKSTLFEALTPDHTGVDFQFEQPDPIKYIKELMFLNPYGGIATGDFDADGLADFFVTSPVGGGRLYHNLGNMQFEDVTTKAGIELGKEFWGTGVTFVDINNDGLLDIYLCSYQSANKLFINVRDDSGNFHFVEQAKQYGLDYQGASMTMAFADIDNDGDLDGYLATTSSVPPPGTKFQVRFEDGKPIVLDHLKEYWELIYLPGDRAKRTEAGQYDHLYRNDGDHFTEITESAGIDGPYFTLSATWWDYNGDNLPDLYASNDFTGPDMLYENLGNGKFKNVVREVVPHTPWFSMGADSGDLNNDGLIDFMAVDMSSTSHYREKVMMGDMEDTGWFLDYAEPRQYMRNALYVNTGVSRVLESAFLSGLASTDWTWNPRIADFDNDGRLDVFFTNGVLRDGMNSDTSKQVSNQFEDGSSGWANFWAKEPMFPEVNHAFRNLGNLQFKAIEKDWGLDRNGVSFGAATADFDNDGDLDLIVYNADAPLSVYRNNSASGNRLRLSLVGSQSNRFGIGATVRIKAGELEQVRCVTLARGWLSSCEPTLQFGLGKADHVDRLTVSWPSGATQEFTDVKANTLCIVSEPDGATLQAKKSSSEKKLVWFEESSLLSDVRHEEVPFNDFAKQPLLPNRLSCSGPAMAWADVNGDGHQDCFLGGCLDRPGRLFVTGSRLGKLTSAQSQLFSEDSGCEDVDALFFDADQDGDKDLYVVSGSNEAAPGDRAYADRLYMNQGGGHFVKASPDTLPDSRISGSVVVAADFDGDGDQDLFVGARSIPGKYPETPQSQLLVNVGGKFIDKTPPSLAAVGLVTGATWADINSDGNPDLLVATDWGPVKLFKNEKGQLLESTEGAGLAKHVGWWTSVSAADIDQDGDVDFVATNFGLNNKYKASHKKPEMLYYGDVDGSGENRLIEAKYIGDTCYPRRGYSCSRNAMPLLQESTKSFHEFASSTLVDLYTDDRLAGAIQLEANELRSGVFRNDGTGSFEFEPLPQVAQIAPSMSVCLTDFNDDGYIDICMAQNFYGPQRETGRMDGGVGLLLAGSDEGTFHPIQPRISGIVVPGDARRVVTTDINSDGLPDLVFAINDGPVVVYQQTPVAALLQTINNSALSSKKNPQQLSAKITQ